MARSLTSNGSPSGKDRRRYPRRNIALDIAIGPAGKGKNASGPLEHTVTVDLSLGGLCVYTKTCYSVGTQLYCAVSVPSQRLPLELVGSVAWYQRVSLEDHTYKLGLEFTRVASSDRALLDQLLLHPPISQTSRAQKVLLVDDDLELIQALKVRFESVGFQVVTAYEGQEALARSRTERPQIIVLDLILPKLNGYEVCRLLKFDEKFKHIPVILLTGRSRQEDINMGYEVGADAYMTKPFQGTALLEKVEELLAKSRGASHG